MRYHLPLVLLLTASTALATDGYFDHGYGVKAKGLGGAGVAYAQDSMPRPRILPAWSTSRTATRSV